MMTTFLFASEQNIEEDKHKEAILPAFNPEMADVFLNNENYLIKKYEYAMKKVKEHEKAMESWMKKMFEKKRTLVNAEKLSKTIELTKATYNNFSEKHTEEDFPKVFKDAELKGKKGYYQFKAEERIKDVLKNMNFYEGIVKQLLAIQTKSEELEKSTGRKVKQSKYYEVVVIFFVKEKNKLPSLRRKISSLKKLLKQEGMLEKIAGLITEVDIKITTNSVKRQSFKKYITFEEEKKEDEEKEVNLEGLTEVLDNEEETIGVI